MTRESRPLSRREFTASCLAAAVIGAVRPRLAHASAPVVLRDVMVTMRDGVRLATDVYLPADGGPELICERVEPSYVTVILRSEGEATVIEDPGEQGSGEG